MGTDVVANGVLHAEVERIERVIVKVDIAKHCAYYSTERARFNGSDAEFVKHSLDVIGVYDLLSDTDPTPDDGITIEHDIDDESIDVIGVVPS